MPRVQGLLRPFPPPLTRAFTPAPELAAWALATFVAEEGPLANDLHAHLRDAHLGMLWAALPNVTKQRQVIGQAELPTPPPGLGKWARGRYEQQLEEWFGDEPLDFVVTLYAPWCAEADDASFCGLVEHELHHCAQAIDEYGCPKFDRETGRPRFAIKGHDVEEFVDVVRRYGVGAAGLGAGDLVAAAKGRPAVARAAIASACGACAKAA